MTHCNACRNALKVESTEKTLLQENSKLELQNVNLILDAVEGKNVGNVCVKSHVQTLRSLLKYSLFSVGCVVAKRSEQCNHLRTTLNRHIPDLLSPEKKLISYESLSKLVEWTCKEGESLRKTDPQLYDDILSAFAWCTREEFECSKSTAETKMGEYAKML